MVWQGRTGNRPPYADWDSKSNRFSFRKRSSVSRREERLNLSERLFDLFSSAPHQCGSHNNRSESSRLRVGYSLEETLTVHRLGVETLLRGTLASTNPIESCLSTVERVVRSVKRWRAGDRARRWSATGLLEAEKKFRRVKGYRELEILQRKLNPSLTSRSRRKVPAVESRYFQHPDRISSEQLLSRRILSPSAVPFVLPKILAPSVLY